VLETFPRLGERTNNGGWPLPGGEQQMLTNPDLLILDEATEGLAPLIAREIWYIISEIRKTGIAAIIVDKNLFALLPLIDRAVVLVKGQVVLDAGGQALQELRELVQQYLSV
jgi:branched-chain amino acid transport system ATP-binding protein